MKKIKQLVVFCCAAMLCTPSAFGWGKKGHTMVVQIAYGLLDSATKNTIHELIDHMSAEQAGSWMDEVRSDRRYDYMKPWHYVNVEKGETYQTGSTPNVLNQIDSAISRLEHRDRMSHEEVKKNILVLFHLIGDMHQPLHVGYGTDKGGNSVQVKYLNKETNLHWVWDSEIIESEHITLNDCLKRYNDLPKPMIERLQIIAPEKWMNQPRSLLSAVYNFQDATIDQEYADRNKTVIEDEIAIAGIRLAAVLNHLFKA